ALLAAAPLPPADPVDGLLELEVFVRLGSARGGAEGERCRDTGGRGRGGGPGRGWRRRVALAGPRGDASAPAGGEGGRPGRQRGGTALAARRESLSTGDAKARPRRGGLPACWAMHAREPTHDAGPGQLALLGV